METPSAPLAVPAVSSLRIQQATPMERTMSQDIRNEREELREAAEQTLNTIVDLNLDGTVKWVSPSWTDVVGTPFESISGKPMSDLITSENKNVFTDVVVSMKKDDSRSYRIRFAVQLGPLSKLRYEGQVEGEERAAGEPEPQTADLEAQGIMVYDSASGGESHTMWMLRPWTAPQEIQIDLPDVIVDSLGSGAELLASYLTRLAESGGDDSQTREPPAPVLCRICERQISPWWFEKHTDLCLQEHRAEMDVQLAQENLTEHRHAIVRVLDALEARKSRSMIGEQQTGPMAEYKGMPIGPAPSAQSSPGTSLVRSRERTGGFGHARTRSFAIRRPQARIVELLMDLCDTAIEISTPAMKEMSQQDDGDLRTQSPQSESRISQVLQWQSPSTNTLEQEQGLALLCSDTEKVARLKVDAVFRHRRIIEYAERIRIEMAVLVQDCIDEAMRKAARIAAGRLSDSTEDETEEDLQADNVEEDGGQVEVSEEPRGRSADEVSRQSVSSPSALAAALRQMDISSGGLIRSRPASFIASTRSSSPKECPTPRSTVDSGSIPAVHARHARRGSSLLYEAEFAEGNGSRRSSSVASLNAPRTESPISEFGDLRRAASTRHHHRRSLVIPGTSSPRRQESPSRSAQPSSPLRIKPRVIPYQEGLASPEASPMFPTSEFSSPVSHSVRHHRRQSSAAISDFVMRAPPSPRLGATQAPPQARAAQPSIKDFEIIKPISKGAFGSVYLSKKKSTGEYFAIKVLKKADMVAKNQVGNVKAERAIMMWQGQSDFVAKLYWTFSSKDYLYLVMEYLNGGDCASLIKVLGGLPEEWVKKYLGEVVLGVEHLHERDIIHRDLKPDNLLIDPKGHLKLTDFGLSRMGLVGRQKRALNSETTDTTPDLLRQGPFARSTSMASSRSTSLDLHGHPHSPTGTPMMTPDVGSVVQPSYFSLASSMPPENRRVSSSRRSDSGGSESLAHLLTSFSLADSDPGSQLLSAKTPITDDEVVIHGSPDMIASQPNIRASVDGHSRNSLPPSNMMPPPMALFDPEDTNRRFVGTPDYLAPETINGDKQDETSDWWSVGCIMFEFLFGIPPFHASEAEKVFDNILARKIQWPDETVCEPVSEEAKDLINKLLCMDPKERLGANRDEKFSSGGEEIRSHPWFEGINWDRLLEDEAQFVPQPENPEDTEYFDARGAVLQSFAEEMEDQMSPQSSAGGLEYPDRPHDALSRVRSQVNSLNRKLMPLHIPPHVRDLKSRRLSEPVATDDFGSFTFKNLPVLEKANKDVIQKLRADAMASQHKQSAISPGGVTNVASPAPSLDGSPVLATHLHRSISNAKAGNRPQSPSGYSHSNSSPSRVSQPSSPLLVSFVAGQGAEGRRKASSNSSSLSHQSGPPSLQPHSSLDVPKVPPSLQKAATTAAASPIKGRGSAPPPLALSPQKLMCTPRQNSGSTTRSRSLTVGSQEASPISSDVLQHHRNRRSQVFDMSPSSSDNEGDKHNALLRVQRRRQSSRRLSQIAFDSGPSFRPLDVLICEDHPVSRMVMEKLLEKLRCRTISVANGSEAVRFSMSEIQFDVIFLEYKLPQISGADVARMIRETKNANSHTPIVAITAYLKELQAPHYFDSLIEKPISSSKLAEVLRSLCQWRPASPNRITSGPLPHPMPTGLKKTKSRADDSPTSSLSAFPGRHSSAIISSREDSINSSIFGDSESVTTDDVPVVISRKATSEWEEGGLGITEFDIVSAADGPPKAVPPLLAQQSAPGQMEHLRRGDRIRPRRESSDKKGVEATDSADDEDEETGNSKGNHQRRSSKPLQGKSTLPSSKLAIEMMRADSHDSVTFGSESTPEAVTQVATTPSQEMGTPILAAVEGGATVTPANSQAITTPAGKQGGKEPTDMAVPECADGTPRPLTFAPPATEPGPVDSSKEATPRPGGT
ncbi:Serine/threonine-protein kinase domain protein [Metarhizium album ARSEF 1941]|uniref:non-specific serine/threonine protein kinase n=1 Tax=Metarhizium album (strain ARSEF 1941) TaxID=1081103 RepID=A0A0B2X0B2_METAS|nr:Serine/threonine-protein kinase domain protein [Metarhizium album ARSEF 1941]KHN98535.1 Serine/threonine-protein kinase domain protein [Metarhizium album ARSEF 1941]